MKHFFTRVGKQIVAATLIVMMSATSFGAFPRQVEAISVVEVGGNLVTNIKTTIESTIQTIFAGDDFLKEFTLDGLATGIAKAALRSIIVSTLNWVASGFEGSPAFVRDLNTNLRQVGDAVLTRIAGEVLQRAIDTPFGSTVASGVFAAYYLQTSSDRLAARLEYTLDRFSQNPSRFLYGDFSQGGWGAWYQANSTCGNNRYCFELTLRDEIGTQLEAEIDQRLRELEYGNGFLSWRGGCTSALQSDGNGGMATTTAADGLSLSLSDGETCLEHQINTPGSVIHSQIEEAVGSDIAQLVSADELNEAIAGLLNSLLQKAIGEGGLAGGSGGGGDTRGTVPNVASSFARTLSTQRDRVEEYQVNWAKIGSAAQEAKAALESCNRDGNDELLEEKVEPALAKATAAGTKAAAALAALEDLEERSAAAGANANQGFEQIVADYQELMASDLMPTSAEVVEAARETANTADVTPASLYTEMKDIAESACSIFRN
ncbi:hypothetical protein K2Y00_02455 [Patescibacteria group bacterium]|nr:hypothetical protein [Patescibacteria group bacterium]